jgi:alcohol dehydrogenase class IV
MHALAHSIGGLFDTHHGTLNAILMPYVLTANRHIIEDDISYLSGCLGLEETFDAFQNWILHLRSELNIPHTLSEINIPKKAASIIGKMSEKDPSGRTNPIIFNASDYENIFMKAILGRVN